MTFSSNVLPTDAAYYTLTNATIADKIMTIQAGGSVSIAVDKTMLTAMTDHLKLNLRPEVYADNYESDTLVYLAVTTANNSYSMAIAPVYDSTGVLSTVFELESGVYTTCTITFTTSKEISFTIWELCPEATADVDLTTIIDGVEQSLPKLLSDYNVHTVVVGQEEDTVAIITCELIANTQLQGHFLVDFDLSEYSAVYCRFYDQDIEELFAPLQFTLNPGQNTITVPHAYLDKLAGLHSFIVTMQCTNGTITIYPRGVLFTIDGGYLAKRLIDIGMDVLDIAISQPDIDAGPTELWAIGIDGGDALVRSRPYASASASVEWTPRYAFGEALDAAVEFDGDWLRSLDKSRFTIQTYAEPYICIVDKAGELTVRLGNAAPTVLDTGVTQITMIRGFKSQSYVEQDQGLVVAYIKDHKAYYRSLAYSVALAGLYWYPAELIHADDFDFVHVHRLNDYRIGFALSSSVENYWLYTDRTYVAQACPPESIDYTVDATVAFITINAPADLARDVVILDPGEPSDTYMLSFSQTIWSMFPLEDGLDDFKVTATSVGGVKVIACDVKDRIMTLSFNKIIYGLVTITLPIYVGMTTVYGHSCPINRVISILVSNFQDNSNSIQYVVDNVAVDLDIHLITRSKHLLGTIDSVQYTVDNVASSIAVKLIQHDKYINPTEDSIQYIMDNLSASIVLYDSNLQPI